MRFTLDSHRVLFSLRFSEINWRSPRTIAVIVALVLLIGTIVYVVTSKNETTQAEIVRRSEVMLASVGNLSSDTAPLPVVGEVKSVTSADLHAEAGGRVTGVYVKLGDRVAAGQIIAETENSAQRAAVLQAEGALDSAQANLEKVEKGARSEELAISETGAQSAKDTLAQTRIATANAIRSAYATNDDLIHSKLDALFSNPRSVSPQFNPYTSDSMLVNTIKNSRVQIERILTEEEARGATLSENSDLKAELARAQADTQAIRIFIDNVSQALNKAIASQAVPQEAIDGYVALASASRSTVSGSLSALSGAAQELNAREAGLVTAQKQLEQTQTGAQSEDIAASQAAVKQSQGMYNSALSALEKTRIRTPISGSVNNLSIATGDFVSPQQSVAVVANNNALEVVAYVTEEDQSSVVRGGLAIIEGSIPGTITRVAPALDPVTRKIEVRIGLPSDAPVSDGQSVRVEIQRAYDATQAAAAANEPIAIPISAVKIEPTRTIIFTLDADNALIAHPVRMGPLMGDKVRILEGLTPDMRIVTDARGLKEGQVVEVRSN